MSFNGNITTLKSPDSISYKKLNATPDEFYSNYNGQIYESIDKINVFSKPKVRISKASSFSSLGQKNLSSKQAETRSSDYLPSTQSQTFKKSVVYAYKDPGLKPICDKGACFERNYSELPPTRLNLIVNKKALQNDQEALNRISQKLAQEYRQEQEKNQRHMDIRNKAITANENHRKHIENLQARTGLVKYRTDSKLPLVSSNPRIQSLAFPKALKKGYAEDYIDSFGLLKAGLLEPGRSVIPKSARVPLGKIISPMPENSYKQTSNRLNFNASQKNQEYHFYTEKEILECMIELNEFHRRNGEIKGRIGFPQIDLEKFKNYEAKHG
jgi:hypothetical protein